jgi:hypothetical protein
VNQRYGTNRGNFSASRRTVLIPSRAKADAQYEPAGPPPTTKTVQVCGGVISLDPILNFVESVLAISNVLSYFRARPAFQNPVGGRGFRKRDVLSNRIH